MKPDSVVFDIGNVLIPWNPRFLYSKLFNGDDKKVEWFLKNICTFEWNETHDAGRPFADGVAELVARHPEYADFIRAYADRWDEMLGEAVAPNVAMLEDLKTAGRSVYALTNWPAEKFPVARQRYPFLGRFDGIVVSGEVGFKKPSSEIFGILVSRYEIEAENSVFIDDTAGHVEAARSLGFNGIVYETPEQLRRDLGRLGLP